MLITFFITSTLLGRLPAGEHLEQRRGRERDAVQVMANGGVAAILALVSSFSRERTRSLLLAGFGGALATAAADTWATEIGSRSGTQPRSILTLQPTTPGASGGVTVAGLAASAVAAALIARLASAPVASTAHHPSPRAVAIALGGFTGALIDSLLGATVQEVRFCDTCLVETEERLHRCGTQTRVLRGARWCDNDMVNAIATAAGATTAMLAPTPLIHSRPVKADSSCVDEARGSACRVQWPRNDSTRHESINLERLVGHLCGRALAQTHASVPARWEAFR